MLDKICFTTEWIDQKSIELHYMDKKRIERAIYAFSILDMLAGNGCPLFLKGGVSQMLLLQDSLQRISTDIDINCPPGTDITDYLGQYKELGFVNYEIECSEECDAVRFVRLYYESLFGDEWNERPFIGLDVLLVDEYHPNIHNVEIRHQLIKTIGKAPTVKVTTLDVLFAEKVFTVICRYHLPCKMLKQLYDLRVLFDKMYTVDIVTVKEAFINNVIVHHLNEKLSEEDFYNVYTKMRLFAYKMCIGEPLDFVDEKALKEGSCEVNGWIYGQEYTMNDAIGDLAKMAYVVTCIQHDISTLKHYNGNPDSLSDMFIGRVLPENLNQLRYSNPEAFFYWYKTEEIYC